MKKDRKNIILQSLAGMLEERNMSKITTASLAEKSNITEAALYRHFPSKRSIYAELFSFCDDTVFAKCNELKKEKISSKEKVKNAFIFFMIFVEKNKGFARLLSREALSSDEQNVSENVNQFYERFELVLRQMLKEDEKNLRSQAGVSAQLIITTLEGNIGRFIRSKFKDSPSAYIENICRGRIFKFRSQAGVSAQLIITTLEGNIGRFIRSKFKDSPSAYIENIWALLSVSIFKN